MPTFKTVLYRLRKRYIGKQIALAGSLGCTEAAISFWENGRRLPLRAALPRILECFRIEGASVTELETLQRAYDGRMRTTGRQRQTRKSSTELQRI
jgi:transcriptional regulator with XRE-family HTH domain